MDAVRRFLMLICALVDIAGAASTIQWKGPQARRYAVDPEPHLLARRRRARLRAGERDAPARRHAPLPRRAEGLAGGSVCPPRQQKVRPKGYSDFRRRRAHPHLYRRRHGRRQWRVVVGVRELLDPPGGPPEAAHHSERNRRVGRKLAFSALTLVWGWLSCNRPSSGYMEWHGL